MGTTQNNLSKREQPQLPFTGQQLADAGIRLAAESAEQKHKGWNNDAFTLLLEFIRKRKQFMCEEFRAFCEINGLPSPVSKRAFGGIIRKAFNDGLIRRVGYQKVKNPKAHTANASLWEPVIAALA